MNMRLARWDAALAEIIEKNNIKNIIPMRGNGRREVMLMIRKHRKSLMFYIPPMYEMSEREQDDISFG